MTTKHLSYLAPYLSSFVNSILFNLLKSSSINHLEAVKQLMTRYIPKAQCRVTQTSENCIPNMKKSQWLFDNGVKRSGELRRASGSSITESNEVWKTTRIQIWAKKKAAVLGCSYHARKSSPPRLLLLKRHFLGWGSVVRPMPSFLNIFWSTSLSITVTCTWQPFN